MVKWYHTSLPSSWCGFDSRCPLQNQRFDNYSRWLPAIGMLAALWALDCVPIRRSGVRGFCPSHFPDRQAVWEWGCALETGASRREQSSKIAALVWHPRTDAGGLSVLGAVFGGRPNLL